MRERTFPSSSSSTIYHTHWNDNDSMSCDCPGWVVKKLNKPRICKHIKKWAEEENLTLEERDGNMFVMSAGLQAGSSKAAATTQTPTSTNPGAQVDGNTQIVTPSPDFVTPSAVPLEKFIAREQGGFVNPMLASAMPAGKTADDYGDGWIAEEKFDGHRIIVRVDNSSHGQFVHSWSRLGNVRTLPQHIKALVGQLPTGVYDGELIVPTAQHSYSVTAGQNSGNEALVLFDMLEVDGKSLMNTTQAQRRAFLEIALDAIESSDLYVVHIAKQFAPSMAAVQEIWDRGGEGAIIKKLSAKYTPGWRSPDWIKVKAQANATLTIVGFQASKNGPHSVVKLLDDQGIETTVKTLDNHMLRAFAKDPEAFIGKRLVISYHEKMPSGKYRHPMFDHLAGEGE